MDLRPLGSSFPCARPRHAKGNPHDAVRNAAASHACQRSIHHDFRSLTCRCYAERYGLRALPVALPDRPWPVVLATLKSRILSPVVERFTSCAREVVQSLVKTG